MTIVLFVRHAENDYVKTGRLAGRLPDVHLNDNGRSQAQAVAQRLKGAPIRAIYCSPLDRTVETAEPIASILELPIIIREGLNEVDLGDWQGKKLKGLSRLKLWKVVQNSPSRMRFPNGESFTEAQYRVVAEIDALVSQHEDNEMIACVSHSDLIKLCVAYYVGIPLDLFQRLHIAPASITTMLISPSGFRLINLNYESSFTLPEK